MYFIVELWGGESLGVNGDWVDLRVIRRDGRENGSEGVVGGVGFKDDLHVWNPMSQYWCSGEGFFEHFKGFSAFWSEIPNNSFSSQTHEWNRDIGVVKNEFPIKIHES